MTWKLETEQEFLAEDDILAKHQRYLKSAQEVMNEADVEDKQLHRERLREKKRLLRAKHRGTEEGGDGGPMAVLATDGEHSDAGYSDNENDFADAIGIAEEFSADEGGNAVKRVRLDDLDIAAQEELALSLLNKS